MMVVCPHKIEMVCESHRRLQTRHAKCIEQIEMRPIRPHASGVFLLQRGTQSKICSNGRALWFARRFFRFFKSATVSWSLPPRNRPLGQPQRFEVKQVTAAFLTAGKHSKWLDEDSCEIGTIAMRATQLR